MLMRSTMMVLCLAAFGCDVDPEIEPDPTSSSGTTAPTTSGTGGDGQGGDGAGGDGAGGTTMPGGGYESGTRLKVRTLVHPGRVSGSAPAAWYMASASNSSSSPSIMQKSYAANCAS